MFKKFLYSIFFCFSFIAGAQTNTSVLKGRVTDMEGDPLPGTAIQVQGRKFIGTSTDIDGEYELKGKLNKGDVLIFSFLGMEDFRVVYKEQKVQNVKMEQKKNTINETVIVAKQNINEIDIRAKSGVVQYVDRGRLKNKPVMSMGLALQGSVAGLVVTNTGDLGQKPKIRIRGNSSFRKGDTANEPLYIKDGQEITPEAFLMLNPMEIKEIKVLKDAVACALYGIKAAKGVIEVTSIRGNSGGRSRISYGLNFGVTTRGRRGVEMMNTEEKLELERRLQNPAAPGYLYSEEYLRKYFSHSPNLEQMISDGKTSLDSLRKINTDWFNELIRISTYQRHDLSIRGGNESTSYVISGSYSNQGGKIKGNDSQRLTFGLGLDQKVGEIGYLSISTNAGYGKTETPNGSSENPTDLVYKLNPYETKQGKLFSFPNGEYTFEDLLHQYQKTSTDKRAGLSASINLKPLKNLSFDAVGGLDFFLREDLALVPASSISERRSYYKKEALGKLTKDKTVSLNLSFNTRVTYNKIFAEKHDLTFSANYDYYMSDEDMIGITGYGVGNHNYPAAINHALKGERRPSISARKDKNAQIGFGLVFGYSYDSIYDFFATYKADASSILPKSKRWNGAWAIGLGWTPGRYSFLKDNKILTSLNFRLSYGHIANLAGVSPESTIGTFSYSTNYYSDTRLLYLQALYNLELKPEQTASFDFSTSLELCKRFSFDFNIYIRQTKDAILDVPIPLSNGFSNMLRNIGILRNEGYELSTRIKILDGNDWRMSLRGSLAYNRNKVVDLYYTKRLYTSESALVPDYEVGKPYDILFGLHSLGINPMTGLPVFRGANGEEVQAIQNVKRENIFALGHSTPPYTGSFNFSLSYRNFDFDMDFYYVFGGVKPYNYTYVRSADKAYLNAAKGQLENMWFKPGDSGKKYHSPFYSSSAIASLEYPNSRTIGKSDYLRLSMLSLRYRIPSKFFENHLSVVKYASIAFQASNLFTITPYKESDPETGTLAGSLQPVLTLNISLTF